MKKLITLIVVVSLALTIQAQDITNTPGTNGDFVIESTTGGILIPRMTQTQRDAIGSPVTGLMIYQTDNTPGFYHYDGSAWTSVGGGGVTSINDLSDGKTISDQSLALGFEAGKNMTTWNNVAVGTRTLKELTGSGQNFNTAVGYEAGSTMTKGIQNIFIGYHSGLVFNPASNTGRNTFVGSRSAFALTTGTGNIGMGNDTFYYLTTGSNNIGITTGTNITTGSDNIIIGKNTTDVTSSGTANNEMNIGHTIYATGLYSTGAKIGIGNGNNAPAATLDVNGDADISTSVNIGTFMHLTPGSAPATPTKGDVYMDDTSSKLKCYDGSAWQDLW